MARLTLSFLLALAIAHAADAADLAGWDGTRWGMTAQQIDAALGDAVEALEPPLVYGGARATREVPAAVIAGYPYRAFLQFNDADGRLQQVLLERSRKAEAPRAYVAALDAFAAAYGEPDLVCDSPRTGPETSPIARERVWRLPTTTIHLVFIDFSGGSLHYDPAQEIDPLVPELERRLHAPRSYPQRLLIRYHPSAREDLMSRGCGG